MEKKVNMDMATLIITVMATNTITITTTDMGTNINLRRLILFLFFWDRFSNGINFKAYFLKCFPI